RGPSSPFRPSPPAPTARPPTPPTPSPPPGRRRPWATCSTGSSPDKSWAVGRGSNGTSHGPRRTLPSRQRRQEHDRASREAPLEPVVGRQELAPLTLREGDVEAVVDADAGPFGEPQGTRHEGLVRMKLGRRRHHVDPEPFRVRDPSLPFR